MRLPKPQMLLDRSIVWLWRHPVKAISWLIFLVVTSATAYALVYQMTQGEDRTLFVSGQMSDGHYQIELACEQCHSPFENDLNQACLQCHKQELKQADDSHAAKVYRDPRNAHFLERIDALNCASCHREHRPETLRKTGVTQAPDFCIHCHQDIAEERPSHQDLPFDGCGQCHNYHDNRALYEDFLLKHLDENDTKANAHLPNKDLSQHYRAKGHTIQALSPQDADAGPQQDRKIVSDWAASAHANSGINCSRCHQPSQQPQRPWNDKVTLQTCQECHAQEVQGFENGRHGMRLASDLSPMRVAQARLPMQDQAHNQTLSCHSCHQAHRYDTQEAAVDACLNCHKDQHSEAYKQSPHYRLWQQQTQGRSPKNRGVSCASCHLPRIHANGDDKSARVQHNQNANLRPNQKQIRSVCLHCHGLQFSLDSLADTQLIQNNFNGKPQVHLDSLEMAKTRSEQHPPKEK